MAIGNVYGHFAPFSISWGHENHGRKYSRGAAKMDQAGY